MTRPINFVLILVLLLTPALALSHHFKGLPHFSYFENYPQVPQEEYLWQEGDYEFSLVIYDFQGITKNDTQQPDNARLYLVIYSLRDNSVYNGPTTLDIRDHGTTMITEAHPQATEESIYAMEHILPETGRYSLGVRIPGPAGVTAEIPFKLSSQKIPWGRWIVLSLLALVIVVAIGSRRARVLRDRRDLMQSRRTAS